MLNQRKIDLSYAYRILSHLSLDDHTYTHLSIRAENPNHFYIYPFGYRFEEVTADSLLTVSLTGDIIEGKEAHVNQTGHVIHGSLYEARPDIQAIFHVHTPAIAAVSSLKEGLMPINQWALHFYGKVSYHEYDSLALDITVQGQQLVRDLADQYVLLMRHHGSITCGRTIQEALFYTYHLEKACQAQCLTLAMNREILTPPPSVCERAVNDLLSFEENLGGRDWDAWVRLVDRG